MTMLLSEDWDIQTALEEFIQGLDNLPSEIQFILDEMGQKDMEFLDIYKSIRSNDASIRTTLQENPDIEKDQVDTISKPPFSDARLIKFYELVTSGFQNASQVMDSKIKLAENSLEVIDKHLKELQKHIEKGEAEQQHMNMSRSHSNSNLVNLEAHSALNDNSSVDLTRETRFIHRRKISANGTHIKIKQIKQRDKSSVEGDDIVYCYCHQVSYGEMIACDSEDCPNEWFHLDCVGLSEIPTGVWYCYDCRDSLGNDSKKIRN